MRVIFLLWVLLLFLVGCQFSEDSDFYESQKGLLVEYLWNTEQLPSGLPTVSTDVQSAWLNSMNNLKQTDLLNVSMPNDFFSVVYHFRAENSNNKLMIYHEGHQAKEFGEENIQVLVNAGYDVMFFSMPLWGMNSKHLDTHDNLFIFETPSFNPISLFITPVITSINYAETNYDYDSISMTGLSGGGWTTTLVAAVDDRVMRSYPVAGSMPTQFKADQTTGEYEETPDFFKQNITYEIMYYLGSYGKNREQVQILNKFFRLMSFMINH